MTNQPDIIISSLDLDRLERLLDSLPADRFPGREHLERELERAEIVAPEKMPPGVVTMNSRVSFRVTGNEESFSMTLVYPKDADNSGTTLSVLAPVGSALLGLSRGDEIEWPAPGGQTMRVCIEDVLWQPERAGELHR